MTKNTVNWVSMQSLIGGFSLGAEQAFGVPPLAIIHQGWSNDEHYVKYMNDTRNLGIPVIEMNSDYETFKTPEDEHRFNALMSKRIDAAIMTPVCAGLSSLNSVSEGSRARGNADNEQNQNMYALTKLGMRMGSRVVAFENAPAAYTNAGKAVVTRLEEIASSHGYSMHLFRTDTLLHGTPQSRKRTFIMFYRDTSPAVFNFQEVPYTPLPEYLDQVNPDMPHFNDWVSIDSKDQFYEFVLDHSGAGTFSEAMSKIGPDRTTWTALQLIDCIGFDIAIEWFTERAARAEIASDNEAREKYLRGARKCQHCKSKSEAGLGYWDSTTYIANGGQYVNAVISKNIHRSLHPREERGYNIRELLHLMGHPHDFEMIEPVKNWNHISQNVPVKTGAFIAGQIREYLDGNLQHANTRFLKQDNISKRVDTPSYATSENW